MEYFAGLFDAEGYVTLGKDGRFQIGTEVTNEEIPNLFKEKFGGNIYRRKRTGRKQTYTWVIATNFDFCFNFIDLISPKSIIKSNQLTRLKDYLGMSREQRSIYRQAISHQIADFKKPLPLTKEHILDACPKKPDEAFWKWLAGFFDGDGNFCVYEYLGKKSKIFDSWISVFNTHGNAISYVLDHVHGSISSYKGAKYPIWKWVCSQKNSQLVCESFYPFLRIKRNQCELLMEFLEIQKTKKRNTSYSFDQINRIRDIINQIKHLNSL